MKFARKRAVDEGLGEGDARREGKGWRGWPLQNFFGGEMGMGGRGGMGGMGGMGVIWVQGKGEGIRDAI